MKKISAVGFFIFLLVMMTGCDFFNNVQTTVTTTIETTQDSSTTNQTTTTSSSTDLSTVTTTQSTTQTTIETTIETTTIYSGLIAVINNTDSTYDSIIFDIDIVQEEYFDAITSVELFKNDQLIESLTTYDNLEFTDLLSGTEYTVSVTYQYDVGEGIAEDTLSFTISTLSKTVPSISIDNLVISTSQCQGSISIEDPQEVISEITLDLYDVDTKIGSVSSFEGTWTFDNLYSDYEYVIVGTITYDLNDGSGTQTITVQETIKTEALTTPVINAIINQLTTSSFSVSYTLEDPDSLATISDVTLFDGETIIETLTDLTIIAFDGLLADHDYEVVFTYAYELNDGQDIYTSLASFDVKTLAYTQPTLSIQTDQIGYHDASFDYQLSDPDALATITDVSLYDGTQLIETSTDLSDLSYEGLLSDHMYSLTMTFSYDLQDGQGVIQEEVELEFTTSRYFIPSLSYGIMTYGDEYVEFEFSILQPADLATVTAIELYDGDTLVVSLSDLTIRTFTGLLSDHIYLLKITYEFDLLDGKGVITRISDTNVFTQPKTIPSLDIDITDYTESTVSFEIDFIDKDGIGSVIAIKLYDDTLLIESLTDLSLGLFEGLLSDHTYTISVEYTYNLNDGQGALISTVSIDFTTDAYESPIMDMSIIDVSGDVISFDISIEDIDGVGELTSITLYDESQNILDDLTDMSLREFTGVLNPGECTIVATYTYDLMDGNGPIDIEATITIKSQVYTINYVLDGGTNNPSNPKEYSYDDGNFFIYEPTREGSTFLGWYLNEDFSGSKITFIAQGTYKNITLYAHWEAEQYIINYYIYDVYDPDVYLPLNGGEGILLFSLGEDNVGIVTNDGRVVTWGENQISGIWGTDISDNHLIPTDVTDLIDLHEGETITKIVVGMQTFILTSEGRLFNSYLEKRGDLFNTYYVMVFGETDLNLNINETVVDFVAGYTHYGCLTSDNRVLMWGHNELGQVGSGSTADTVVITDITFLFNLHDGETVDQLFLGRYSSAAITSEGRVFAWGNNDNGQLGTYGDDESNLPLDITSMFTLYLGESLTDIAYGDEFVIALTSNNRVLYWGNSIGDISSVINYTSPQDITSTFNLDAGETVISISAGKTHVGVVTSNFRVLVWGKNDCGQLGTGNNWFFSLPTDITSSFDLRESENIIEVEFHSNYSAALTSEGRIFTWGENNWTLGNGTDIDSNKPLLPNIAFPQLIYSETNDYYSLTTPYSMDRDGYDFHGWYTTTGCDAIHVFGPMPGHNISLYGYVTPSVYTINYELSGGNNPEVMPDEYTVESETIILCVPTKVGYIFEGWYSTADYTSISLTQIPMGSNGDLTLYAKWTVKTFDLSFETSGATAIDSKTFDYAESIVLPSNPVRIGYDFGGWYLNEELTISFNLTTMPEHDVTIYAKWEPKLFVVTYVLNNGSADELVLDYAGSDLLIPSYADHVFLGWYTDSQLTQVYASDGYPTSNITLYAKWTDAITVQYVLDGGVNNNFNPTMVANEITYQLYQPHKDGYDFLGWYDSPTFDGDALTSIPKTIEDTLTLYAKWTEHLYTIDYYIYDDYIPGTSIELNPNETIIKTSQGVLILTSDNRLFYWEHDYNGGFEVTEISNRLALDDGEYIKETSAAGEYFYVLTTYNRLIRFKTFDLTQYEITDWLNLNDSENIDRIIGYGGHFALLTSENRLLTFGDNSYGCLGNGNDIDTAIPIDITANFNLSEGEIIIDVSLGHNYSIVLTSEGRVFTFGLNEDSQLGVDDILASAIPIDITNRFLLHDDEVIIAIEAGGRHSAALTSEGRVFTWGWNVEGQLGNGTNLDSAVPIDITEFFGLTESEYITEISFGYQHSAALTSEGRFFMWGSNYYEQLTSYAVGLKYTPYDLTLTFEALGLTVDHLMMSSNMSIVLTDTGRLILWGYDLSYENKEVPVSGPFAVARYIGYESFAFGTDLDDLLPNYSLGYEYEYWFMDETMTQKILIDSMPSLDMIYFGYAIGLETYEITYVLDGGTMNSNNPTTYTIESENINLYASTKSGYGFIGWYDNPEFLGEAIATIPSGSVGDIILYAKWGDIYTVTYDLDGGINNLLNSTNYTSGLETMLADPSKEYYDFLGWYDNPSFNGNPITYISADTVGDITLYAKWVPTQYTISYYIIDEPINDAYIINLEADDYIVKIVEGHEHTIVLTNSGRVFTTGGNDDGQLGVGPQRVGKSYYVEITDNFDLADNEYIIDIAAGDNHSGALTNLGRIFTWGCNDDYQLGNPNYTSSASVYAQDITQYFQLEEGEKIIDIEFSVDSSYAFTSNNRLFAWGEGYYGQLCSSNTTDVKTPTDITPNLQLNLNEYIVSYSLGHARYAFHAGVLTSEGRLLVWGFNDHGQVGDGTTTTKYQAVDITSLFNLASGEYLTSITFGNMASSALTSEGRVFTWGSNAMGRLGVGSTIDCYYPQDITANFNLETGDTIQYIDQGISHMIAVSVDGRIFAWGYNGYYQLATGDNTYRTLPEDITENQLVSDLGLITKVFAVGLKTYFITSDHQVSFTSSRTAFEKFYNLGTIDAEEVLYTYNEATVRYEPTLDGYVLDGWYTDTKLTTLYVFNTMPGNDVILYGKWFASS
jgi:uncharacterized repeat protein (TIGR02543 family)